MTVYYQWVQVSNNLKVFDVMTEFRHINISCEIEKKKLKNMAHHKNDKIKILFIFLIFIPISYFK